MISLIIFILGCIIAYFAAGKSNGSPADDSGTALMRSFIIFIIVIIIAIVQPYKVKHINHKWQIINSWSTPNK